MITLEIALQKKQSEFYEAIDQYDIVGYGGARGGAKSTALRYCHLLRRIKYPGSTGAIFRGSYPELESNHIRPLFQEFPILKNYWHESKKVLTLPNGSIQLFRHCGSMNDAHLHQGQEYHDFAYDEAGALSEELFDILRASNRSSNPNIPARCQLAWNWGAAGHKWLKRRFIDKNLKTNETAQTYHFIPARLEDNPALMKADPDYEHRLMSVGSESLRKAWRWGDYDIEAGQYFSDLRRDIHLIEPFEIPDHWGGFCSYDYGWAHPNALLWWAVDEDGTAYVYREHSKSKESIEHTSKVFNQFTDHPKRNIWHAGHDCWVDRGSALSKEVHPQDPTIAEAFAKNHIYLKAANIDRKQGASFLRESFRFETTLDESGKMDFTIKPKIYIFNNCELLWDTLTRMVHDPNKIEDVLKEDSTDGTNDKGDDLYDSMRYGAMSRFSASPKKHNPRSKYSLMNQIQKRPTWRTV